VAPRPSPSRSIVRPTRAAVSSLREERPPRHRLARRRTVGDPTSENRLIVADNAQALASMRPEFEGRFRCIYLDPPFNTGRRFDEYEDALTPEGWRSMMRARLALLLPLLADDGAVFVEIDDTELGSLVQLMDEVFGRAQRVSIVTIVRSASTGHKAINRGPVNVTDFLLVYEKSRGRWKYRPERRTRAGVDRAYSTFLENPEDPERAWRFEPLARVVAAASGYGATKDAVRAMGRAVFEDTRERFALEHADHVVRFAQPRYEAVSREARALIDRSRAEPDAIFRLERSEHPDLILRGGNRLLFLSRKVRPSPTGPSMVEPLTNLWDDVPFQGLAKEGGVVFSRNKKPERLLARILGMSSDEGDWVLDPFLGSGTTAAVAHKMGRRWVGIERGEQAYRLCVPRLSRVIAGKDLTGVTGATDWRGGGGFGVYA
jgi:adenine-specific DNA-methyltransferase